MIRECKKLLPYILNLIIITVRDILRAQNLSLSADFSVKFLIKKRSVSSSVYTRILNLCRMRCTFSNLFFLHRDFYVQNSRYLTFTLAKKPIGAYCLTLIKIKIF